MKRFPILGTLLLVPALAMLAMVGCGKTENKTSPTGAKTETGPEKTAAGAKKEITTPLEATVKGVVKLKGKAPEMKEDPRLSSNKADAAFCLSAPERFKIKQEWIVGKDNELANVVVSLSPPAGMKFKIDDDLKKKSKKTVIIDQPFCNYDPHVVAVWPAEQGVEFTNSAKVTHNVKVSFSKLGNPDLTMKPPANDGKPTTEKPLYFKGVGESIVNANCSMHTWMNCKIAVFTNPYFAVTKADGSFEIHNVPIDEELTVYLWHESKGDDIAKDKVEVTKVKTKKGDNDLKVLEFVK